MEEDIHNLFDGLSKECMMIYFCPIPKFYPGHKSLGAFKNYKFYWTFIQGRRL